jgi:hypothetical protein
MTTQTDNTAGAYLAKGTIGNVVMPGAPIVNFSLVVVPGQHKVSGMVQITQAVLNGNYSGQVTGTIYATGLGEITQIVALTGAVHQDGSAITILLPFEAHMAINGAWKGKGGFSFGNVHVEDVPVTPSQK